MIIVDSRESHAIRKMAGDETRFLEFTGEEGQSYSYDYLILTKGGKPLKAEAKAWPDFIQSWIDGKLSRQLSYVDFLIVERPQPDYLPRLPQLERNAEKHLTRLSLGMCVIVTDSPQDTVRALRDIESFEDPELIVRANKVKAPRLTMRQSILRSLRGINPDRALPSGETVGEVLERQVNWTAIEHALNMEQWPDLIPRLGETRLKSISKAILRNDDANRDDQVILE